MNQARFSFLSYLRFFGSFKDHKVCIMFKWTAVSQTLQTYLKQVLLIAGLALHLCKLWNAPCNYYFTKSELQSDVCKLLPTNSLFDLCGFIVAIKMFFITEQGYWHYKIGKLFKNQTH